MGTYFLRRVLQAVPTLFLITLVVFVLINLAPGGPASSLEDSKLTAEDIARQRASMGLDRPLHERYLLFLGGLVRGDLGNSLVQRSERVTDLILARLPATLLLTFSALVLSLVIAVPLGVLSAVKPYSLLDNVATFISTIGIAIPGFWLALILILVFAVTLGWFPVGGVYNVRSPTVEPTDVLWHLVLPATALAFINIAVWNRYIRASMLEVIRLDYVRTARAKGLTQSVIVFKHGMRNALIPFVTLLGLSLPQLVSGALVIETVFGWSGMGRLAFTATGARDYPVIMGVVIMASVITVLGNLMADLAYGYLDPRIRYN